MCSITSESGAKSQIHLVHERVLAIARLQSLAQIRQIDVLFGTRIRQSPGTMATIIESEVLQDSSPGEGPALGPAGLTPAD